MTNTSATGGYLVPATTPAPLEADALDAFFQQMVVGITGLTGSMVRPRWQPTPPTQPDPSTNWCAIGVVAERPDDNAVVIHDPTGDGSDQLQRHEEISVLASFYGPAGQTYAALLRDGLWIAQNREPMQLQNMGLVRVGEIISAPELVNAQWIKRYDVTLTVRRQIIRVYPVLDLLAADGTVETPDITDHFQS